MKRCENCRFSAVEPLQCRRNPPVPIGDNRSSFALVRADWYCGAYRFSVLKWLKLIFASTKKVELVA